MCQLLSAVTYTATVVFVQNVSATKAFVRWITDIMHVITVYA